MKAIAFAGILSGLSLPYARAEDYSDFAAPPVVEVDTPDVPAFIKPLINFDGLELVVREPDRKTIIAKFKFEGRDGEFYTAVREAPLGNSYLYAPGSSLVVPEINLQILHLPFWMDWDFGKFRINLSYSLGDHSVAVSYRATGRLPDGSYDARIVD